MTRCGLLAALLASQLLVAAPRAAWAVDPPADYTVTGKNYLGDTVPATLFQFGAASSSFFFYRSGPVTVPDFAVNGKWYGYSWGGFTIWFIYQKPASGQVVYAYGWTSGNKISGWSVLIGYLDSKMIPDSWYYLTGSVATPAPAP